MEYRAKSDMQIIYLARYIISQHTYCRFDPEP